MTEQKLPDLPYAYDALEPVISKEIMELHHKKHHNTYVTNLNKALSDLKDAESKGDVEKIISLLGAIKFNGGGHVNHSIFWTNLAPQSEGGGKLHEGPLSEAIKSTFGSLEQMIEKFNTMTAPIQGSGWGWLGYHKATGRLVLETCANQDPLSTKGLIPLLGIDVWEHAYYLQYKNVRPDYLKAVWGVVNWKNVEERFLAAQK